MEQLIKRCQIALQIGPVEGELPEDFVQSVLTQGEYTKSDLFLAEKAARILNEDYVFQHKRLPEDYDIVGFAPEGS